MTADDARATLVRELRDGANAWVGSGMSVGATVKLLVRAAGALDAEHARAEAAESNRDEFRNAWNAQGFEIIRLEDERDRLLNAIKDALKVNMFRVGIHAYGNEYERDIRRILRAALSPL